ncbi:ectoine/hydroxyectoine ABC transporter substrate-binding protein EhuB [Dongia deserti]|uniref:ectoine/hydroxyectoine ABC transporter substrate-binding protein EhuB n=1 Tax=Dongia deserti TaxID=2268030 RepID=UPI000E64FDBC|nr:ectoine/hydroxyectoine ABC transporter substrate-binding protein EhuB [Dongia deserti]
MTAKFRLQCGAAVACIAILCTGAMDRAANAETTLEKIKAQGVIRLGFTNEAPFAYATPDGQLTGVVIEVLHHIFDQMGVKDFDGGLTTFGGLIPGLKAKRFDLVTSSIYIKPDRCTQVAFAEPLYILGDGVAVKVGNPRNIHSYADVAKDQSIKLAYTVGGTGITENAQALGVRPEQLVPVPDDRSGYAAVQAGRVDGFANPASILESELQALGANSGLERASPFEQPVENGKPRYGFASFAVRLEDQDLLQEINQHLSVFRASPEFTAIMSKYGFSKDDMIPEGVTTSKICAG